MADCHGSEPIRVAPLAPSPTAHRARVENSRPRKEQVKSCTSDRVSPLDIPSPRMPEVADRCDPLSCTSPPGSLAPGCHRPEGHRVGVASTAELPASSAFLLEGLAVGRGGTCSICGSRCDGGRVCGRGAAAFSLMLAPAGRMGARACSAAILIPDYRTVPSKSSRVLALP